MNKWYIDKGDQGDIVLSTRIRLARNLDEFPFPAKLDVEGKNKVNELVKGALFENDGKDFSYIEMKDLSRIQAVSLAERHLISPEFAAKKDGRHRTKKEPETEELSEREKDVLVQLVKGLSNKEIADALCISTHTVISHRKNITRKQQIHSTAGLTIYAIVHKLVDINSL